MNKLQDFLFKFECLCGEFFISPPLALEEENIKDVIKSKISNEDKINKIRKIFHEDF